MHNDDIAEMINVQFEICDACNGDGSTECEKCGSDVSCEECDGLGQIDRLKEAYEIQLQDDKKRLKSIGIEFDDKIK